MKRGLTIVGGLVLAAMLCSPAFAASGRGKGGGGSGGCCAGGLPALWARVTADEAAIALLQSQVATLTAEVTDLQTDVADLKGQNNWAVVASDGTLNRSHSSAGPVTSGHVATGQYEVTFAKDVSKCAYTATLGDVATAAPVPGFVNVSGDSDTDSPDDVFVYTFDKTGAAADASFHLNVTCP